MGGVPGLGHAVVIIGGRLGRGIVLMGAHANSWWDVARAQE
jgi:hypothetical protein